MSRVRLTSMLVMRTAVTHLLPLRGECGHDAEPERPQQDSNLQPTD